MNAEAIHVLLSRAASLKQLGRIDEAITVYEDVLASAPQNYAATLGLAAAMLERSAPRSRELAKAAIALVPQGADAFVVAAYASSRCGRNVEAVRFATQAVALAPWLVSSHVALAQCLVSHPVDQQLPRARAAANEAIRLDPTNPTSWYALGRVDLAAGNLTDAKRSFLQSLKMDPTMREAQSAIATLDQHDGRLAPAMAMLQTLVLQDPSDSRSKAAFDDALREILQDLVWLGFAVGATVSIFLLMLTESA